ncbi:MAG: hypothetical protein ACE5KM_03200 [Planctomycetaceae bacterium]
MTTRNPLPVILLLAAPLIAGGCNSKKTGEYKTAAPAGKVTLEHDEGPHGGTAFDVGMGHKYMAVLLLKDRTIEIYLIDHRDKSKAVFTTDKEITITGVMHDGKKLADVTLKAAPLKDETDTWSHFAAAAPDAVKEAHALNGANFTVTIAGKTIKATIKAHEHDGDHKK